MFCGFYSLTHRISEKETELFKWWPRLHGYWRTLPNFNPYTVSSEPGRDLAGEAQSVLLGTSGSRNRVDLDSVCATLSSRQLHYLILLPSREIMLAHHL